MTLIFLNVNQLKRHPENMRRFYPEADVAEMAESIRAAGGLYQALLVVPNGEPEQYYVVDGNMRLAGAKELGAECPPLKAEIINWNHAQQLLAMAATTQFHYPKDPISKALHFRRLQDEGYKPVEIAEQMGCSTSTIYNSLTLLDLEPEIQELIGQGKLPGDINLVRALLALPVDLRRKLARRFADRKISARQATFQCRRSLRQLETLKENKVEVAPPNWEAPKPPKPRPVVKVEPLAVATPQLCGECRELINNLAEELCGECMVNGLSVACLACPGVIEFVTRLVEITQAAEPVVVLNGKNGKV